MTESRENNVTSQTENNTGNTSNLLTNAAPFAFGGILGGIIGYEIPELHQSFPAELVLAGTCGALGALAVPAGAKLLSEINKIFARLNSQRS